MVKQRISISGASVQCVDLAKMYFHYVLGLKTQAIGNAEAYWRRYDELPYLKNNFIKIANTPTFIPQKGDVAVWDKRHGKYGHIAICNGEGTTSYFYSYDQNWIIKKMHLVKHNYKSGFAGVLRPKNQKAIYGETKYKVGDVVQTKFQVRVLGDADSNHYKVESNGYIFELEKSMVNPINKDKIGNVIQRGTIFAVIDNDTYGIEVLDRQFLIKDYYIEKKL
jgi:hypothetical protein